MNLDIATLRENYLSGKTSIKDVLAFIKLKIEETKDYNIWIYTLNENELEPYIKNLENKSPKDFPLYGIPFAIKDNIDL